MDLQNLDMNELYLLFKDNYIDISNSTVEHKSYLNVDFFKLEDALIIENGSGFNCSCGDLLCWHVIKVILDKSKLIKTKGNIEDFNYKK